MSLSQLVRAPNISRGILALHTLLTKLTKLIHSSIHLPMFFKGLTCPNSELRMVRKLISDAEEAALDLRERREDLLDSGTREQEDGDGLMT